MEPDLRQKTMEQQLPDAWLDERQLPEQMHRLRRNALPNSGSIGHAARLLLITEDGALRQALQDDLQQEDYQLSCPGGIRDGSDLFRFGIPSDLILLDLCLADQSGLSLLQDIRSRYSAAELPVLVIVDVLNPGATIKALWLGANDSISRPLVPDELRARVRNTIQMRRAVQKLVASEMAFLQAQIKPHFIFNTLSVLTALCTREPETTRNLLFDLSDYLHESFDIDNPDGLTTLIKELKLVRAYLAIEQARFSERLQVSIPVDPDTDCLLPLLSIQPIVENAIHHGLSNRNADFMVTIRAEQVRDRMMIQVLDNGRGMSGQQIAEALESNPGQSGVALRNINRRLLTLYGSGLQIASQPGKGTKVSFAVPCYGLHDEHPDC